MDFNEIKNTWKSSFKDDELLNKEEIEARLKIGKKSNSALTKVKRNYKIELVIGVAGVLYIIKRILSITTDNHKYFLLALTLLFFGFLFSFTWRNYKKVRKTVISNNQLKPALIKTISDIEKYVKFNRSNYTKFILLPFAICIGMVIGIISGAGDLGIAEIISGIEKYILKIVVTLVVASAVFIPLSQYFNKKMYKQHLDELKQCLKETED